MANIWSINVCPADGLKFLEMLLANMQIAKPVANLADYVVIEDEFGNLTLTDDHNTNSSESIDETHQVEPDRIVDEDEPLAKFLASPCSSRRNAFGNIWDFETFAACSK
jgi:hypothetical protein